MGNLTASSPAAVRARNYRRRQREGTILVPVETSAEAIDGLVRYGFLDQTDIGDRDQISNAIALILQGLSKNAVNLEPSWVASLPRARPVLDSLLSMIANRRHP